VACKHRAAAEIGFLPGVIVVAVVVVYYNNYNYSKASCCEHSKILMSMRSVTCSVNYHN